MRQQDRERLAESDRRAQDGRDEDGPVGRRATAQPFDPCLHSGEESRFFEEPGVRGGDRHDRRHGRHRGDPPAVKKRRKGGVRRPVPPQKGPQKLRRRRILRREADDRRARDADPHRKLHVHAEERQDQDRRSGNHRRPAQGKTPRKQRLDIDGALLILPDERSGRRVDSAREKKGDQRRRDHVADVRVYVRIRQLRDE